jgi:DNA-dependent RNA polymerase auxiliary subunit epsilon
MTTKIKSLTIVANQGVREYLVGRKYNGLLIAKIEDICLEYEDSFHSFYRGITKDGDLVFEAIDAPINVEYEADNEDTS